jgi:hypothetical protein
LELSVHALLLNSKKQNGSEMAMKKLFLTTVGLVALGIVPALAADLPARTFTKAPAYVAAAYDWSGFYAGINAEARRATSA